MAKIEPWAIEPLKVFHEQHHRHDDVLHMLMESCHFIQARPIVIELMREKSGPEQTEKELALAKHYSAVAVAEQESDFQLLHFQAVAFLWGTLEALLLDFFSLWLVNKPEVRELDQVRSLKIGFGEYDALPEADKGAYLLDKLEDKVKSRHAGGISRFESLFTLFGLSSELDLQVTKDLLELNAVRNVALHNRGIVDFKFKNRCPWIKVNIGDTLVVTHQNYHRYLDAVELYVYEVMQRLLIHYGIPRSGHKPSCRFYKREPNHSVQSDQPSAGR